MTKKEEPLHGQDLRDALQENPPGVWVTLHERKAHSI